MPIFFSMAFLSVIVMPTIFVMVDDNFDASIAFSISEEEERGCEKDLDIELLLSEINFSCYDLTVEPSENGMMYFYKRYTKPHLYIISPPPELHII